MSYITQLGIEKATEFFQKNPDKWFNMIQIAEILSKEVDPECPVLGTMIQLEADGLIERGHSGVGLKWRLKGSNSQEKNIEPLLLDQAQLIARLTLILKELSVNLQKVSEAVDLIYKARSSNNTTESDE